MSKGYWKWTTDLSAGAPCLNELELAELVLAGEDIDDYFCDDEFDEED